MDRKTQKILKKLNAKKGLQTLLSQEEFSLQRALRYLNYEKKLEKLQVKLIRLQEDAILNKKRILVIFEGRDAAGKGGVIRRITERINPRYFRIVALPKPNEQENNQWYFRRYISHFPKDGELVFFDRSWYNRAIVEPVNGFCTQKQYQIFMNHVNHFEKMLQESGMYLIKIYLSITKKEQAERFSRIQKSPLKKWKMTEVDRKAQELWDDYTHYKNLMFQKTNTQNAPWKIIKANRKTEARLKIIQYLLDTLPYDKNLKI